MASLGTSPGERLVGVPGPGLPSKYYPAGAADTSYVRFAMMGRSMTPKPSYISLSMPWMYAAGQHHGLLVAAAVGKSPAHGPTPTSHRPAGEHSPKEDYFTRCQLQS